MMDYVMAGARLNGTDGAVIVSQRCLAVDEGQVTVYDEASSYGEILEENSLVLDLVPGDRLFVPEWVTVGECVEISKMGIQVKVFFRTSPRFAPVEEESWDLFADFFACVEVPDRD